MVKKTDLEEEYPIINMLCRLIHCQSKSIEGKIFDIVVFLIIFSSLFYWILIPIWNFLGVVTRVLGGRG